MIEKSTFDGESGILLRVPGRIVQALGNIVAATTCIAVETYKDFRPKVNNEPNIQN